MNQQSNNGQLFIRLSARDWLLKYFSNKTVLGPEIEHISGYAKEWDQFSLAFFRNECDTVRMMNGNVNYSQLRQDFFCMNFFRILLCTLDMRRVAIVLLSARLATYAVDPRFVLLRPVSQSQFSSESVALPSGTWLFQATRATP